MSGGNEFSPQCLAWRDARQAEAASDVRPNDLAEVSRERSEETSGSGERRRSLLRDVYSTNSSFQGYARRWE